MRQAVILVGGRGTRLGALAADTPKPLVLIAGETRFLDFLIADIARHGVEEILLLAGHMGDVVSREYDGRRLGGAALRVIVEPSPAGTAGALRYAADALDDTFLMTNGDSFFDFNYLALAAALRLGDIGAIALRRVPDAARFGRVDTDGDRVIGFHEKDGAFRGEASISAGAYVLRRDVLDLVTALPCSLESEVFPKLAAAHRLGGVETGGDFIDIGLPDTLAEARATLVDRMRRGAVFFDRDGTLTADNGYTHRPEELAWLPGAIEAIRAVNDAGRLAIVVTNQAGVARGYYDEGAVARFHAAMQAQLLAHGAHVDAFYHCPYHGEGVVPGFTREDHPDRKPNPGMLRRALTEWPIDCGSSFLVGDHDKDVAAAQALGIEGARVAPGELLAAVRRGLAKARRAKTSAASIDANLKDRARVARAWLFEKALPLWWARGYDRSAQCFHEGLAFDGSPIAAPRRVFVQARQTIVYGRAGALGWLGPWHEAVSAGANVLLRRCLRADGGTRHSLNERGEPFDQQRDLYDLAFILLALAEASVALRRPELNEHADELLAWLDANWALPQGGFQEGDADPAPPRRQNPHMHMFEAFLALHEASGESAYLERANQIAALFSARFVDETSGALPEYYDDAWSPLADERGHICEPGHHFEWSWLLHRWRRLGGGDLSGAAERLRVHAEIYGVDLATDDIYEEVLIDGSPRLKSSRLWAHTERIKANLARFEHTRDQAAGEAAVQAFDKLLTYFDKPSPGLWRDRLTGGVFDETPTRASSFYHIMFALFELIRVAEALD